MMNGVTCSKIPQIPPLLPIYTVNLLHTYSVCFNSIVVLYQFPPVLPVYTAHWGIRPDGGGLAYFTKLWVQIPKWDKIVPKDLIYSEIEAIWPFEAFLIDFWLL